MKFCVWETYPSAVGVKEREEMLIRAEQDAKEIFNGGIKNEI